MKMQRTVATLLALAFLAAPALAWQQGDPEAEKAEKARAREARIQEYLRKKEERRARRELARSEQRAVEAALAEEGEQGEGRETVARETQRRRSGRSAVPRHVQRIHEDLRRSQIGKDPTVEAYMQLIESGEATPHQLAAFGSFLGEAGLTEAGIAYYGLALGVDDRDPLLWTNVGTLHRKLGEYGQAIAAYSNALGLDRTNAFAHYNLGTVLDEQGKYDEAIEEYKIALTLDPTLGDPAINPQAANNERLLAVRLLLYREGSGADSLPLLELPGGSLDGATEPD